MTQLDIGLEWVGHISLLAGCVTDFVISLINDSRLYSTVLYTLACSHSKSKILCKFTPFPLPLVSNVLYVHSHVFSFPLVFYWQTVNYWLCCYVQFDVFFFLSRTQRNRLPICFKCWEKMWLKLCWLKHPSLPPGLEKHLLPLNERPYRCTLSAWTEGKDALKSKIGFFYLMHKTLSWNEWIWDLTNDRYLPHSQLPMCLFIHAEVSWRNSFAVS